MEKNAEYHDPDYPEAPTGSQQDLQELSDERRIEKIKVIVQREFINEIKYKEEELNKIDQRISTARRMLNRLRYSIVSQYYSNQKLMLTSANIGDEVSAQTEPRAKAEVSTILRNEQKRIHPSVKKLLGRDAVDLDDIFKFKAPRNKMRKNYLAMVQSKNYTIPAESTVKSLRPDIKPDPTEVVSKRLFDDPSTSKPKKVPRYIAPKVDNVTSINEATRNKKKHKYRIIIGNTSKYAPPSSKVDRSTHKWLLYVRGPPANPDLSAVLTSLTVTLHDTYAPHHRVQIDKPPFHISRRGWGEFPAQIELQFALPLVNRPVTLQHTIKLDRNYTGLQTLGAETIVDVWLYSDDEMLKYEFKESKDSIVHTSPKKAPEIKQEVQDIVPEADTSWMDFFTNDTAAPLNVDEMIIKPVKKETAPDPTCIENQIESSIIMKECEWSLDNVVLDNVKTEPNDWDDRVAPMPTSDVPNEILSQTSPPKKRIMKYMDPTTGKIYYLEMDRNLDISKVQEIIINSKGNTKTAKISPVKPVLNGVKNVKNTPKKSGVSLLKPEVKNQLSFKNDKQKSIVNNLAHIENDHCYIAAPRFSQLNRDVNTVLPVTESTGVANEQNIVLKMVENVLDNLCRDVTKFSCIRVAVNYLLSKIPLISDCDRNFFPFVVNSEEKYWTLDVVKRRNVEWSRAKLINRILNENFKHSPVWRTRQILLFARLHGYYPIKQENNSTEYSEEQSWWQDSEKTGALHSNIKEIYSNPSQINSLSIFQDGDFVNQHGGVVDEIDLTADEDVDVLNVDSPAKVELQVLGKALAVLPVENEEERLRFIYIEKKCAEIGIELRNEDVGNGYSYSAVHAVMLRAVRQFAEELVRAALAQGQHARRQAREAARLPVWISGEDTERPLIGLHHVYRAAREHPRLRALSAALLATTPDDYTAL